MPAAAVLKLLPRTGRSGPLNPGPLITSILVHHRAPFAVYAGWNAHAQVKGFSPPRRLLPSPLNALVRSFTPEIDNSEITLDTFEFLDMDAY